MKKINKIAVILVAIMTAMISGCKAGKADINKSPIMTITYDDYLQIMQNDHIGNIKFKDEYSQEEFYKQRYMNFKNLVVKNITMTGKRECKLGKVTEHSYHNYSDMREKLKIKILNFEDCPPKDRLTFSYIVKLKTNYGTFTYDFGDKSTSKSYYGFMPIESKGAINEKSNK